MRIAESKKFNFYHLPEALAEHIVSEKSTVLNNIERNTKGHFYLIDTHIKKHNYDTREKKKLIRKRHSSMMRNAALLYNYRRNYSKSRLWFIKAIKEDPFNINNYAGAVLSLFRIKLGRV